MGVKKIVTTVLEVGGEELALIPVTAKNQTISTPNASGTGTNSITVTSLQLAGVSDKIIGYLIKLDEEEK